MIRVMVVDDQELVRSGLVMIIGAEDDLTVVAEAGNGAEALAAIGGARPDVVLMDIEMPSMSGIEATRRINALEDPPSVVILTTFDRDDYLFDALRAGAAGFLLKNSPGQQLIDAIRLVASGAGLLSPQVTRRVLRQFSTLDDDTVDRQAIETLTPRERAVLALVARGRNNQEIAAELIVSEATVKSHVSSVLLKLGLRDRVQAAIFAVRAGVDRED